MEKSAQRWGQGAVVSVLFSTAPSAGNELHLLVSVIQTSLIEETTTFQ